MSRVELVCITHPTYHPAITLKRLAGICHPYDGTHLLVVYSDR